MNPARSLPPRQRSGERLPHGTSGIAPQWPRSQSARWRKVGERMDSFRRNALWRAHCDRVHWSWVQASIRSLEGLNVLKTDVFEEAAGEGLAGRLRRCGARVFGVDVAENICAEVRRRGLEMVAAGDVMHLPFAAETFDLVISTSTLDHLASAAQIRKALLELRRVMRPGGRLLISLDNPHNPLVWLRNHLPHRLLRTARLTAYPAGATLTQESLCGMLTELGFEIEQRRTLLHCPRILALPAARLLSTASGRWFAPPFERLLWAFESLEATVLAKWTGHFIAVRARLTSPRI